MKLLLSLFFSFYIFSVNAQELSSADLAYKISDKVFRSADSVFPNLTKDLNDEIDALLPKYYQATSKLLKEKNIDFDLVEYPESIRTSYSESFKLTSVWKHFKLKKNNVSSLNTKALQLNRIDILQVVYDPILLNLVGGNGAYAENKDSDLNTLFISESSIQTGVPDYITQHEIIHYMFESNRRGKTSFMTEAPVNITFTSQNPIQPNAPRQIYSTFMSYEEMITHAFNIKKVAEAVVKNEPIHGVTGAKSFLDESVLKLVSISMNALESSSKALNILSADNITIDNESKKYPLLVISTSTDFSVSLFIPSKLDITNKTDVLDYAKKELEKSIQLAQFNINYFKDKKADVDIDKARVFMSKQTLFIKSL